MKAWMKTPQYVAAAVAVALAGSCDGSVDTATSGGYGGCPEVDASTAASASSSAETSSSSSSSGDPLACEPMPRAQVCADSSCGYLLDRCGGLYACGSDTDCTLRPGEVCLYGATTSGTCAGQDQCKLLDEYSPYCKLNGYSLFACNNLFGPLTDTQCKPATGPATCVGYPGPRLPFLDQPTAKAACCIPCVKP